MPPVLLVSGWVAITVFFRDLGLTSRRSSTFLPLTLTYLKYLEIESSLQELNFSRELCTENLKK